MDSDFVKLTVSYKNKTIIFSFRSLNEEDSSMEHLMKVLKYLRKEKELMNNQLESVRTELSRVSRQMDHFKKRAEESEQELETNRFILYVSEEIETFHFGVNATFFSPKVRNVS